MEFEETPDTTTAAEGGDEDAETKPDANVDPALAGSALVDSVDAEAKAVDAAGKTADQKPATGTSDNVGDAKDVDAALDTADGEGSPDANAKPADTGLRPSQEFLNAVLDGLGEPGEHEATALKTLNGDTAAEAMANADPAVRGIMRATLAAMNAEMTAYRASVDAEKAGLDKARVVLQEEARQIARNRADLAKIVGSDKLKGLLAKADVTDDKLPDALTQEGIEARIERATAKAFQAFQAPIAEEAGRAKAMAAYEDFTASHPEMRDPMFRGQVVAFLKERKTAGENLGLATAFDAVQGRIAAIEARARRDREANARAEANAKIARESAGGGQAGGVIPAWVNKDGYQGETGNVARTLYIRDNPRLMQAFLRELGQ